MEIAVSRHVGAERHERTPDRTGQWSGDRERQWDSWVGTIGLPVRAATSRAGWSCGSGEGERALVAVVQEAYVQGVSTRRVDEVVQALGQAGISQISRLCRSQDEAVERFRGRRPEREYPDVWLATTFVTVWEHSRVVSTAMVIAIGVRARGSGRYSGGRWGRARMGRSDCSSCGGWRHGG